jgi:hypothetical protein
VAAPARARATPRVGGAPAGDAIGVLEVETSGVSETAGDKFEESVERTLAEAGTHVVRSKVVQEKLMHGDFVSGCTFGPCMREVGRLTGLKRVLVGRIEGIGQSYSVVVSVVGTESGQLVSQVAQRCPVCTVEEAISTSALAVVEVIEKEARARAAADAAAAIEPPAERLQRKRRDVRDAGRWMVGGAIAVGATGGILLANDEDGWGGPTLGAAAALALGGLTCILLSRTF